VELLERGALLAELSGLLVEARHGRGRVALLAGEAGIGKTSLVEAFCAETRDGVRVLWGSCDAVVPARPFGPLADLAAQVGAPLGQALRTGDRDQVIDVVLALLRRRGGPTTVVVFDDLHWADEATLDLLRVIGRRMRDLPVLLVGTYRDHEVGADHPLRLALGDLPPGLVAELHVPALSLAAMRALVGDRRVDPVALHRITAGNPFFATEVISGSAGSVPVTVRDAVIARVARLTPTAGDLLRTAAALGHRFESRLLRAVADGSLEALEECRDHGMLEGDGDVLAFRHELAQRAIHDTLGHALRRTLHARILAALRGGIVPADPARLAHHATQADDEAAIRELAPLAGDHATVLGAHREAAAHYAAALRHVHGSDAQRRAELLEAHARECSVTDDVDAALVSQREALELWRTLGDRRRQGDALRALSSFMYLAGEGEGAIETARSAVTLLEPLTPAGPELAWAWAALAQRIMVAGHDDAAAIEHGARALRLAESFGEERIAVHALTTLGTADIYMGGETGWVRLDESVRRAMAIDDGEAATRALINLVEAALDLRRYDVADRYVDRAMAYMEAHDFELYHRLLRGRKAQLAFERGHWREAEDGARALLAEATTANLIRARALTLVGQIRVRRGESDPWGALDAALQAAGASEVQELAWLHAARAEAAWLDGDADRARTEAEVGLELARMASSTVVPWFWSELAFWAWKSGGLARLPEGTAEPYRLQAAGDHAAAAASWAAIGCPYQRARALADSEDEAHLREALRILRGLGARPLAGQVEARLRRMGARQLPRGPRRATRGNPRGLTDRELEVLALLAGGLHNSDIAERLVLSPKTVDHHVSAILAKLGVRTRKEAAHEAPLLERKDGEVAPTT